MSEVLKWLSSGSATANIIISLIALILAVFVLIYLIAFLQGREISFWPPKIGERKRENVKVDKLNLENDIIAEIRRNMLRINRDVGTILNFHIMQLINSEFGIKINLTTLSQIEPEEGFPENKDFPHILFFSADKKSAKRGDIVNILFTVRDDGFNFPNNVEESGVEIVDT